MSGEYKIYCIGGDDHIEKRHDIKVADDAAAIKRAREVCGPHEVEVWDHARFVTRIKADGTISGIPSKGPHADS
jgi:hypothetical protein